MSRTVPNIHDLAGRKPAALSIMPLAAPLINASLPVLTPEQTGRRAASLVGLLPQELEDVLEDAGEQRYRGRQVFAWIHQKAVFDPAEMTTLPVGLRRRLTAGGMAGWTVAGTQEIRRLVSSDGLTQKVLLSLRDQQEIEVVEMRTLPPGQSRGRRTVCISTQAGCAMGCVFCVTGQGGFARNLDAGEIVEQVLRFSDQTNPVTNVVFMGMGEPLANYDASIKALRLLTHPDGLNLGARRITVSTSGLVPQIYALASEGLQIGLAISLHAPNDVLRSRIMPINRRWGISELLAAADAYVRKTGRRVSFEYSLMAGLNDSDDLAEDLAALLAHRLCHVNLIPLNPSEDPQLRAPTAQRAASFQARLLAHGVPATIRINRGRDIQAACGQLRRSSSRAKPSGVSTAIEMLPA